MAVNRNFNSLAYGLQNALQTLSPEPIVSSRNPSGSDKAELGTIWVNTSSNAYFVATSTVAGQTNWQAQAGGSGTFASVDVTGTGTALLVNSGNSILGGNLSVAGSSTLAAVNVTGDVGITGNLAVTGDFSTSASTNYTISATGTITLDGASAYDISDDAVAATLHIGTGAAAKTVVLGSTNTTSSTNLKSGSGGVLVNNGVNPISISADAAATTVLVGTGAGAKTVTVGSSNTTSTTVVAAGSGGLALSAAGLVSVVPGTVSSASTTPTLNKNVGVVTVTGLTTAAAATQVVTITNSLISATSGILCSVSNLTASGNTAAMQILGTTQAASTLAVTLKNNGAQALGAGDNVIITFWIIS